MIDRIALYPYCCELERRTVVVLHKRDLEEFRSFVASGEIGVPANLYYVVPEAAAYVDVLLYWLKYKKFPECGVENARPETVSFFSNWEDCCSSPFSISASTVRAAIRVMPHPVREAISSFELLGDLLTDVYDRCLRVHLLSEGIYQDYQPDGRVAEWWRSAPPTLKLFGQHVDGMQRYLRQCESFGTIVESMERVRLEIATLMCGQLGRALDAAARLCFLSGEFSIRVGQPTTAVVLFHRALDFFLQARCWESQLLRETGNGLEFSVSTIDPYVGVMSCYRTLIDNKVYPRRERTRTAIRSCNAIRNKLLLAHSMYGASTSYSLRYRDSVRACLIDIDLTAARKLISTYQTVLNGLAITPALIFSLEPDLKNSLVEVVT